MADKRTSVFGIYPSSLSADSGVDALVRAGFPVGNISMLLSDASSRELAHEKHTKAPEGTATGATAGGAIGGTLGLLVGIGAIAIPGLGPFIAAGPIMATLAGIGAGGTVGGLLGALSGLGIPEYRSQAVRGPGQERRRPRVRALRYFGPDQARQGRAEEFGRRRHCLGRRGEERAPGCALMPASLHRERRLHGPRASLQG